MQKDILERFSFSNIFISDRKPRSPVTNNTMWHVRAVGSLLVQSLFTSHLDVALIGQCDSDRGTSAQKIVFLSMDT